MAIEFDPDKDASNLAKHGLSLAEAEDMDVRVRLVDARISPERRYRAYGYIAGVACCRPTPYAAVR